MKLCPSAPKLKQLMGSFGAIRWARDPLLLAPVAKQNGPALERKVLMCVSKVSETSSNESGGLSSSASYKYSNEFGGLSSSRAFYKYISTLGLKSASLGPALAQMVKPIQSAAASVCVRLCLGGVFGDKLHAEGAWCPFRRSRNSGVAKCFCKEQL